MNVALSTKIFPHRNGRISLKVGILLRHGGIVFQVIQFIDEGVLLKRTGANETKLIDESALIEKLLLKEIEEVGNENNHLNKLSQRTQAAIHDRQESDTAAKYMVLKLKWLNELEKLGMSQLRDTPRTRSAVQHLSATTMLGQKTFEISTLHEAQKIYSINNQDPVSLLPNFSGRGGRGKSRLHPEIEKLIAEELQAVKEKNGRIVKQDVIERIQERSREQIAIQPEESLRIPGASTVARRFEQEISKYEICVRNEGKIRANRLYRDNGVRVTANHPLVVVEYDDVDTGVFMVHEHTRLPIGRGFLTSGIDQHSLVITGFSIGHEHRSSQSAIGAIVDGLIPKNSSIACIERHLPAFPA